MRKTTESKLQVDWPICIQSQLRRRLFSRGSHLASARQLATIDEGKTAGHLLPLVFPEFWLVTAGAAPGVPDDEWTVVVEGGSVRTVDEAEAGAVPDPPAAADSCAKPTDGGLLRYTE